MITNRSSGNPKPRRGATAEFLGHLWFALSALVVVFLLILVYYFVGSQSFQTFSQSHISPADFFLSSNWDAQNHLGISYFIIGSLSLVVLSLVFAVPISLGVAVFISEIAPKWLKYPLLRAIELFLGIPSVIFGLFGLIVIVPLIRNFLNFIAGGIFYNGYGLVPAAVVVTFMILPTVATIAYDAMQAVPRELREGSYALGSTRRQTISKVVIPAAGPGIMTGIILGIARALGETVAVAFVIGNSQHLPFGISNFFPYLYIGPTSVLTTQLLFNFKEATVGSPLYNALWTISFVLLVISAVLVAVSRAFAAKRIYS